MKTYEKVQFLLPVHKEEGEQAPIPCCSWLTFPSALKGKSYYEKLVQKIEENLYQYKG